MRSCPECRQCSQFLSSLNSWGSIYRPSASQGIQLNIVIEVGVIRIHQALTVTDADQHRELTLVPWKCSGCLSHSEIRSPLCEPHSSLTTSSRNILLFVGVYVTAGWESSAMGNQCILPAICCFHPLIHKFLPKFILPHPSPHFYLRVIGWTWWEAMHR